MADEQRTQFDYLLNAMEHAAQEAHPAKAGYAGKRKALFAYVRELEAALRFAEGLIAGAVPRIARDRDEAVEVVLPRIRAALAGPVETVDAPQQARGEK